MKQANWIVVLSAMCLLTAACSKKVALDNTPKSQPPVQAQPQQAPPAKQEAKAAPQQAAPQTAAQPTPQEPKRLSQQQRADLNALLARLEPALFDYDKATIRPDAATVLRSDVEVIRSILADYPAERLLIEGHADERGTSEYNLALGDRRAVATREFLSGMGIPGSQLQIMSYGEERPVCTDQGESCWQRNRRAHITVAP